MLNEYAEQLVREAKLQGLWLYDAKYNMWETPESFETTYSYVSTSPGEEQLRSLQLKNPLEGIELGFSKLDAMHKKLEAFVKNPKANYPPEKIAKSFKNLEELQRQIYIFSKKVAHYYQRDGSKFEFKLSF